MAQPEAAAGEWQPEPEQAADRWPTQPERVRDEWPERGREEQWPGETGQAGGHWAAAGQAEDHWAATGQAGGHWAAPGWPEGRGEVDGSSGGDTGQYGMNEPYGYAPDPRYSTYHPQERFPGHGEPYAGGGRHAGHGHRYEEPTAGHDTHAGGDTHAEQAQVWETSSRLRQPAWLSPYQGEPEAVPEPAADGEADEADKAEGTGRHGGGGRAPGREDRPPRHG